MLRGLYAAASGLQVGSEQQDVTAHNLSHLSTPGYRRRGIVGESFDNVLNRAGDILGARVSGVYHDFRAGPVHATGNPYDLALAEPDQFFALAGPNGPLYTRNGTFQLTAAGRLVSPAGYELQGENGPVEVPPTAVRVNIASDGTVTADGADVGQVRRVRFADLRQLTAAGPALYTAPQGTNPQAAEGRVIQGYLEGANVQPADAMVQLLLASRFYDAAQRSLRTISESVQLNTRPTG